MAQSHEVVLDTNMLVVPAQFRIDIADEIRRLVPGAKMITLSGVVLELEKMKNGKIGMEFIQKNDVGVIESQGHVDDAIVEYARDKNAIVATNDAMLIKRLKEIGAPVVRVRKKQTLALEGHITGGD
jgi:rRNA-processing protein FCF1